MDASERCRTTISIELNTVGNRCNLACAHCYENEMRDAGSFAPAVHDVDAMLQALEAEGVGTSYARSDGSTQTVGFSLFGGEPLLERFEVLDRILTWSFEKTGKSGIQSNATLITDAHVALFKRCQTYVGVSLDGPDELNDIRWAMSVDRTRELTAKSQAALERLLAEGIGCGLIVTVHAGNASDARRPRLKAWLADLARRGIGEIRLHTLQATNPTAQAFALSQDALIAALRDLANLERDTPGLRFDMFRETRQLLRGDDESATCIWGGCDPYTTAAVSGVDAAGQRSNCGRVNLDGVNWLKADRAGHERYIALYHTPQEHGGCQGCRFFFACHGECPGTAIRGDWRNRTEHCATRIALFEDAERDLLRAGTTPISASPLRGGVETMLLAAWQRGHTISIARALKALEAGLRPDQVVGESGNRPHGDRPHGDAEHGDRPHGDHQDQSLLEQSPHGDGSA